MRFAPLAWLAFVMAVWAAPRVYAETAAPADVAWAEIQSSGLLDRNNWDDFGAKTRRERMERVEQAALQLKAKGLAFFAAYPADPRRWLLVEKMMALRPRFTKSYGPDFEKKNDYVIDEPAAAAWEEQLKQLEAEMLAAGDLPADQRERVEFKQLFRVLMGEIRRASKGEVVDWKEMVESVARFGVKYPHSEDLLTVIDSLMRFYEPNHTREENEQVWHAFAASPNAELAEVARPKAKIYAHSMELAFTAVDGRKVDLRALRGKVVLIDFWATWCGSCIQELPNIKKVYAAYHDKGFEAIGVALENPQINPNDSPEVSAAKMAKAKKGLTDFVAKQDLPWPQYFDDANAKNELSERYRIVGIPAGFLLDQDGNVVSLYSRGERLEADVKRLLKL